MTGETLVASVVRLSNEQPDKSALILKEKVLTYLELRNDMITLASELLTLGVHPGDRVLYCAISAPESVVALLAIQCCGAIAVSYDKNASADTVAHLYQVCNAKLVLTDKHVGHLRECASVHSLKLIGVVENVCLGFSPYEPDPEEIAEMIFTTGTTGVPKGVMLSYRSVSAIWHNTIQGVGLLSSDRVLLPLPLNHSVALRVLRSTLYMGATVIFQNGFTFAKSLEENIIGRRCTALISVPASMETIRLQMRERFAEVLGQLRYIEVGAGSLSPSQRVLLSGELPNTRIINTWGSSETGGALFVDIREVAQGDGSLLCATGKPVEHVSVKIIEANDNGVGRLALYGEMAMSGYWGRPDLTKDSPVDGWVLTNDLAYIKNGYVFLLGRADDIINVGGEKVSPVEVENVACLYDGVLDCACIGADDPDGIMGQVPVLFAVPYGNRYSSEEFRNYLASALDRFKMPHSIVLVEAIPRNRNKKVDRKGLRRLWAEGGPSSENKSFMNETMRSILGRKSIRNFTDEAIDAKMLDAILRAGYQAPSGSNMQTWRFTVLEKHSSIEKLKTTTAKSAQSAGVQFYGFNNPNCVVLVSNDMRNPTGCQDCSCAAQNMMVAAASFGVGTVWINTLMSLRDAEPVKSYLDELGVSSSHIVWAMIALGYPSSEGVSPARKRQVVNYIDRT